MIDSVVIPDLKTVRIQRLNEIRCHRSIDEREGEIACHWIVTANSVQSNIALDPYHVGGPPDGDVTIIVAIARIVSRIYII